jgi:hypothetical protein
MLSASRGKHDSESNARQTASPVQVLECEEAEIGLDRRWAMFPSGNRAILGAATGVPIIFEVQAWESRKSSFFFTGQGRNAWGIAASQ